jgi:leucyl aminopeptidase (aminopeptidase T)
MQEALEKAAQVAIKECLAVQAGERVLVVTDENKRRIGRLFWEAAKEAGAEAMLVEMIPRKTHAEEPPRPVAEMMKQVDVVIAPTTKSLSHTQARKEACEAGARVATLPGITEEIMARGLRADYQRIKARSENLAPYLTRSKRIRVTSPAGTDLTFSVDGRAALADTGIIHNPGGFGNLPAGEVYIAPVEGTAEGVLVFDGCVAQSGILRKPVICEMRKGYAVRIHGSQAARSLVTLIEPFGKPARNLAEFGIGTNDKAKLSGHILEDEKVLGTVHFALGDNHTFGGKVAVPSHLDGILLDPTVLLDGKLIMERGKFAIRGLD